VRRRVRLETADRFCQLPLGPDSSAAPRLVPRDRDVHEALQEVALLGRRRTPGVLQLLVRREVLARLDQLQAGFKP
jgi:hypothetical protein